MDLLTLPLIVLYLKLGLHDIKYLFDYCDINVRNVREKSEVTNITDKKERKKERERAYT